MLVRGRDRPPSPCLHFLLNNRHNNSLGAHPLAGAHPSCPCLSAVCSLALCKTLPRHLGRRQIDLSRRSRRRLGSEQRTLLYFLFFKGKQRITALHRVHPGIVQTPIATTCTQRYSGGEDLGQSELGAARPTWAASRLATTRSVLCTKEKRGANGQLSVVWGLGINVQHVQATQAKAAAAVC